MNISNACVHFLPFEGTHQIVCVNNLHLVQWHPYLSTSLEMMSTILTHTHPPHNELTTTTQHFLNWTQQQNDSGPYFKRIPILVTSPVNHNSKRKYTFDYVLPIMNLFIPTWIHRAIQQCLRRIMWNNVVGIMCTTTKTSTNNLLQMDSLCLHVWEGPFKVIFYLGRAKVPTLQTIDHVLEEDKLLLRKRSHCSKNSWCDLLVMGASPIWAWMT